MRKSLAAAFTCLGLAACASGGGGGSPATVVSTPTPTPTNTALTSLVASQTFANTSNSLTTTINSSLSVGPNSATQPAIDGVTLSYDASAQTYSISTGFGAQRFATVTDRDSASSTSVVSAFKKANGSTQDVFLLFNPGSGNSKLALTYTSYGAWQRLTGSSAPVGINQSFFVFGLPTTDMPRTGTANYVTAVDGFWVTANDARGLGGTGVLTADFGAGTTQLGLSLSGVSAVSGLSFSLGNFSGGGTINNATFTGALASTSTGSAGYSGAYAGRFFGPAAQEAGATFTLTSGSSVVTGVIVGHR